MESTKYAVAKRDCEYGVAGTPFHLYCIYSERNETWIRRKLSRGSYLDPQLLSGKHCGFCNDTFGGEPGLLPPFPGPPTRHCLNCPPKPTMFPMDGVISVGFGSAFVSKDGEDVLDGEEAYHEGKPDVTGADAEALAVLDPDHDWRIQIGGPFGGQVYQRHAPGEWVYVKRLPGFV